MFAVSVATVRKCLMAVPALGTFGPIAMVIGLPDPSFFGFAISCVGALAIGFSIAILGAAVFRFMPSDNYRESDRR
jgi:hypothetical protein